MAESPLVFHAAPPAGHWLNDPNGLVFVGGAYQLFAQHRADAPHFRETGWARFSSPDLMAWSFEGVTIPPRGEEWMYSGCVLPSAAGLEAYHTVHRGRLEHQVRRLSHDGGASWTEAEALDGLGAPARNRRDPFIFADRSGWALLLAEPCDWAEWEREPASRLRLYRSGDRRKWAEQGTIGPWRPRGIMWEVPLLVCIDGHDVLFVSEVDRRGGGASCGVRAWIGTLTRTGFRPLPGVPEAGQLVDHGPDFYALMASACEGWPGGERAYVAWLSNWQTARAMPWPAFHGGPISIPRALSILPNGPGPRLASRPHPVLLDRFTTPVPAVPQAGLGRLVWSGRRLRLLVTSASGSVSILLDADAGQIRVERRGTPQSVWTTRAAWHPASPARTALLFVDGPILEFFSPEDGTSVSIALDPAGQCFGVTAATDSAPAEFQWLTLGNGGRP